MILDKSKTIDLLTATVLETREEYSLTADNLDEIQLIIDDRDEHEYVLVENDHGSSYELCDLSESELEAFCYEYEISPAYDIEKSVEKLRLYLINQIKPFDYRDGTVLRPYVHCPDNVEDYLMVKFINTDNVVCLDDPFSYEPDGELMYGLDSLYIDDLLKIIQIQKHAAELKI